MAYNQFKKLSQLEAQFAIKNTLEPWLPTAFSPPNVSTILLQYLHDATQEALTTEKAKSEYVVAPVIKELRRHNPNKFSSFSGFQFDVDKTLHLVGFCDFILSAIPHQIEIDAPIFCLVEAKNAEIEKGLAQCGAEMYAAKLYNERKEKPRKVIFGCVTNAFSWCFLKLENNILYIDPNYVPLTFTEPHRVLATLQWILDESLK